MSNKLSEVIWEDLSGFLKFGISEKYSMYSFILMDTFELVVLDMEVEALYLILKDVIGTWSRND